MKSRAVGIRLSEADWKALGKRAKVAIAKGTARSLNDYLVKQIQIRILRKG